MGNASFDTAIRRVAETDWDLSDAWTSQDLHDLHWYPATFPPQVPRLLVSLFSQPGDHVLDPFCGSGTTLLESVKARRFATGVESNPIGVLIAEAKLLRRSPSNLAARLNEARSDIIGEFESQALFEVSGNGNVAVVSPSPVAEWYHEATYAELVKLWTLCNGYQGDTGALLRCIFSAILKSASAQREHWGYVADNMRPRTQQYRPACSLFLRKLDRVVRQLGHLDQQMVSWDEFAKYFDGSRVIHGDVRLIDLPGHSIDLVVTSPPYAGVTDYARSQRLTFEWFGWHIEEAESCEIGARWKRRRATATSDYCDEMRQAMEKVAEALRPRAICVFVIGQSSVRDADQGITNCLVQVLAEVGLKLAAEPLSRERSRQRLVNREVRPSQEALYVFRKDNS